MDLFGLSWQEIAIAVLVALVLLFYVAMLKHLLRQKRANAIYKLVWSAVIIFIPLTGALLYYWFCVTGKGETAQK